MALVARRVDWKQFGIILLSLRWRWVLASLLLTCLAQGARSLRLAWILGDAAQFPGVWRAMSLGYLGRSVLPIGGGELVKIGALRSLLGIPATTAAAGAFLDRLFDIMGMFLLAAVLVGAGESLHLRTGPLWAGVCALALISLGTAVLLRRRALRTGAGSRFGRTLDNLAEVLGALRHPGHLGRLLAAEALVSVLDLAGTYVGLLAFAFGPALPFLVTVRLSVYQMFGAALPLLPGGAGTLQVASFLALQPAGVSAAGAFAFSLVAQGAGLGLSCLLGGTAAFWPGKRMT